MKRHDVTERPILFNGQMVPPVLAGTKTQTRRVVKLPRGAPPHAQFHHLGPVGEAIFTDGSVVYCPYGKPGDRLWVREAWGTFNAAPPGIVYKAGPEHECGAPERWRPSIHMPRWASRITLEVTGVRVERLGQISEPDAIAEGVNSVDEYIDLWKSINKTWEPETWIWVLQFQRV